MKSGHAPAVTINKIGATSADVLSFAVDEFEKLPVHFQGEGGGGKGWGGS